MTSGAGPSYSVATLPSRVIVWKRHSTRWPSTYRPASRGRGYSRFSSAGITRCSSAGGAVRHPAVWAPTVLMGQIQRVDVDVAETDKTGRRSAASLHRMAPRPPCVASRGRTRCSLRRVSSHVSSGWLVCAALLASGCGRAAAPGAPAMAPAQDTPPTATEVAPDLRLPRNTRPSARDAQPRD